MRKRNWRDYWKEKKKIEKISQEPVISINEMLRRKGKLKKPTSQNQIKITPTSSFVERQNAYAQIKKLGLDKMVEKVCKIFGKVDGKGVDQISIKWN